MIIFLCGEDTYRSTQKLNQIKNKFIKEVDSTGMNLTILDGAKLKFEEFSQQVKASPFLARKRMIIIKNLISENKSKEIQKKIVELLDQAGQDAEKDNILVFWENSGQAKSKSKNALWNRLTQEKLAQEFIPLKPSELNSWLKKEVESRGGKINNQAINFLAASVGNDLWQMSNEIEKLINYCSQKQIIIADIESLVKNKFDDNIFNLVDAIGNKNKKLALKLMSDQFNLEADKMYLLSMLIRQFRILLLIKDLQKNNPSLTKDNATKELKIHPFVAQKALQQARNFTFEQLKLIYQALLGIDFKIKTSTTKPRLLFDLLIAQI
ncbi:MAG TPA: DNA polymerase III subunit delta [Candidatus Uhrbacteria bacterium]|nr:DNA polymerase III subunit delta [Candidatus Uhrbacteria bacterium]